MLRKLDVLIAEWLVGFKAELERDGIDLNGIQIYHSETMPEDGALFIVGDKVAAVINNLIAAENNKATDKDANDATGG